MTHERIEPIEPIGVACASGRHDLHLVTLVSETAGTCAPACEAAQFGRRCHHVGEALQRRAKRQERERVLRALMREGYRLHAYEPDADDDTTERVEAERAIVAAGSRE